ncbi:MAG: holo-ACP synthase [Actinomycetales bacterium]|nr:holo-ACP synthase [Actinomycetales bacterium]
MTIKGVGVDLVDIARFEGQLASTNGLLERLFAADERETDAQLKPATLAGKFAAKEAFIKAVGGGSGMNWHDVRVIKEASGRPQLVVSGETAAICESAGIVRFHLSIAHDGGMAIAYVIAEGNNGEWKSGGAHA